MKEDTDDFQNNQTAYEDKPVSEQFESFLLPNKKEKTVRWERKNSIDFVCVWFYQLTCL